MLRLLGHWILSAFCILVVARLVPGFVVSGFGTALLAAIVIGLVNGIARPLPEASHPSIDLPDFRHLLVCDQRH